MNNMGDLELNVELTETEFSKCYYNATDRDEINYLRVIISGSLNKNAK